MKKLYAITLVTLTCMLNTRIQSADNGFHLDGLDDMVNQAAAKAIHEASATAVPALVQQAKDNLVPAIKNALDQSIKDAQPILKKTINDAQPVLKQTLIEAAPPILISTFGLFIASAGLMLVYQGCKAENTEDDSCPQKTNTSKLFGYGSAFIIIGLATIFHTHIKNFFNTQK